jgi:hypothetical protein
MADTDIYLRKIEFRSANIFAYLQNPYKILVSRENAERIFNYFCDFRAIANLFSANFL